MRTKYHIIRSSKELKQLISACRKTGYACVDFETNAESLYNKDFSPTILSVSFMPGFGCSIPLDHFETSSYVEPGWDWKKSLRVFGERVIENRDVVKVAWNAKFDFQIFEKYHIYYRGTLLDGMLAKYLLNEERPNDLKSMVSRYIPEAAGYESDKGFDRIPWDQKPLDKLCQYGCQDTDYTLRLTLFFENKLIKLNMYALYRNLVMPSSRVLQAVEKNGLYLDRSFNQTLLAEYQPKIDRAIENINNLPQVRRYQAIYNRERIDKYIEKIEDEISSLDPDNPKELSKIKSREKLLTNVKAGVYTNNTQRDLIKPLNFKSNVDLPALMYSEEGLGFSPIKKTDKGKPSTDEETLVELRMKVEKPESPKAIFLDNLLQLRGLEKMYKTYILGWSEKVQDDNCLHGKFNIIGTTSGRLSSSEPNLQQIPKTSVDPNIKKQLIARPGTLYMAMDFSQAELRIMAHLSGDETYLKAFREGQDPHLAIAAKKYHTNYEEASAIYENDEHPEHKTWKIRRKQAKQIAFGIIYGIQAKLLSQKLSDVKAGLIVTPEEAQQQLDDFFEEHPKIKKFMKKQEKLLRKQGYISSLFGRKRRLPQVYSDDSSEAAYAVRLSVNMPCLLPSSQALSKTKGWVNYEELEVGDEILAFNPDIQKTEWQPVIKVNVYDYDGDMIRFYTKHLDVLSTPDHRWFVTKPNKISDLSTLQVKSAKELFEDNNPWAIPLRAPYNNPNTSSRYPDAIIGLLGWWLTDGSIRKNQLKIYQSEGVNTSKVEIIDTLFKGANIEYSRKNHKASNQIVWSILDNPTKELFNRLAPDRVLNMNLISSLDTHQLEILYKNMRLGDGMKVFCSGSKVQAELIQAITVLLNNTSSMYEVSHDGDRSYFKNRQPSLKGQEYIQATKTSYGVKFSNFRKSVNTKDTYNKDNNLSRVPYKGKVWCPTIPSGAFVARVIGEDKRYRTLITGNCQSAASDMCLFGSILLYWLMRQGKLPMMESVTLVHDANYFNPRPQDINLWVVYQMWNIYRNPSTKKYFGFSIDDVDMSMDFSIGRSMAEELPFIPGYDYTKMLQPDFSVEAYMEEHKKFKGVEIKDYPKIFKKEFKAYEKNYTTHK